MKYILIILILASCATSQNIQKLRPGMTRGEVQNALNETPSGTMFQSGYYIEQYRLLKSWVGPQIYYLKYDEKMKLKEWFYSHEETTEAIRQNQKNAELWQDINKSYINNQQNNAKITNCTMLSNQINCIEY